MAQRHKTLRAANDYYSMYIHTCTALVAISVWILYTNLQWANKVLVDPTLWTDPYGVLFMASYTLNNTVHEPWTKVQDTIHSTVQYSD